MPFTKGTSGNPAGKPPGASSYRTKVQNAFIDALEKKGPGKAGKANFQKFLETFMDEAVAHPDGRAAAFVAERLFSGNILQEIDATLQRDRRADLAFLKYRIRESCFDVQQQILDTKQKVIMLMAGRRAGKTEVDIRKAAQVALTPHSIVLFVGLTYTRCMDLFWNPLNDLVKEYSIGITREARNEGVLVLDNGSEFHFVGNSTVTERDKLRGGKYDLVIIDEAQSQPALAYLIESVLEPTLKDKQGTLLISGTGPRVRGTRWGFLWNEREKFPALRLNWNMTDNPYMPDCKSILATTRAEKGWTEDNPVYVSEYLGKECFDDDALCFRLTESNFFTRPQLAEWVKGQPPSDIKFVAGIDYGFVDSTAVSLLCYSIHKEGVYLIYENKFNRSGVTEVIKALDDCIMAMGDPVFANVPQQNKKLLGYADTAGGMQSVTLEMIRHGYNILSAIKDNKAFAIEQLQEEVRRHTLKVEQAGPFADESLRIIFARDEASGNLTREIDDSYHPDSMDSLLYAFRHIWTSYPKRLERPEEALSQFEREEREFFGSNNKLLTI